MNIVKSNATATATASAARQYGDLEPGDFTEACTLAGYVAETRLNGVQSPHDALTRILTGHGLGLGSMASIRAIHVIEGKAVIASDAMVAICRRAPDFERFECEFASDEKVTWVAKRRGEAEQRVTWTLEDAKRAGLLGRGTWSKFPRQMLNARAKSELARLVFSDMLFGILATEEVDRDASAQPSASATHAPPAQLTTVIDGLADTLLATIADAAPGDKNKIVADIKLAVDAGHVTKDQAEKLRAAYTLKFAPKKTKAAPREEAPAVQEPALVVAEVVTAASDDIDRGDNPDAY